MTRKMRKNRTRILVAAGLFILLFVCHLTSAFSYLPGAFSDWTPLVLSAALYLYIGYDVLTKAGRNIAHGKVFDENFLMVIATFGAFFIGEYEEAVAVMLFYQIGEWFQKYAVGKSRQSISDLMKMAPAYANRLVDRVTKNPLTENDLAKSDWKPDFIEVDPTEIKAGELVLVKAGEKVPLDGVVIRGQSFLDTARLTGESVPRRIAVGDAIVSGCVNTTETLVIRVTAPYENSTVARILELVENATSEKAPVENFISRFARYYTPAVTIGAVLLALLPPLLFNGAWTEWIRRACTFLVISCPCALVISIPLSFFGGIGAASRIGVLVKGSVYLETLAKIRNFFFDKTGTLTAGDFQIRAIHSFSDWSEEEILSLAASLEKYSNHPIARAILRKFDETTEDEVARRANAPVEEDTFRADTPVEKDTFHAVRADEKNVFPDHIKRDSFTLTAMKEYSGLGISGEANGITYYAGNRKFAESKNIAVPAESLKGTIVYLFSDRELFGAISIYDDLKETSAEALRSLKEQGAENLYVLTGDRQSVAEEILADLPITAVYGDLLPEDKVKKVQSVRPEKTAFVGDGINDAPVLVTADVGIAMGALGSAAAMEAADIVLMDDDLRKISRTVSIAGKTIRIVRENIALALGVKFTVLLLGALGFASMWLAMIADVGVAVAAILNAMRLLRSRK